MCIAQQLAEKVCIRAPAPEGAVNSAALAVCLKAYPDTNLDVFHSLSSDALIQNRIFQQTVSPTSEMG
jgi:hypothetical protein